MRMPAPKDLSPLAQAEWKRIVTLLGKSRTLDQHDVAALTIYATSYADYIEAAKKVQEQGTVVLGTSGTPVKNPYMLVMTECWNRLKTLLTEFGLTPKSRAAIKPPEPPDDEGDDFSDLGGK